MGVKNKQPLQDQVKSEAEKRERKEAKQKST